MKVRDRVEAGWDWLTRPRRLRALRREYYIKVPALLVAVVVIELGLVASFVVVFLAVTQHSRIEARTDSVEIEFSPGQPIAWALGSARLLDCSQLAQVASPARMRNIKPLADEAEISLAALEVDSKRLNTVR